MGMSDDKKPPRLLVVDDDLLLRSVAVKSLRHADFEVTDAANGEDALYQFECGTYDLILLDVMMPGLSGYEVCQRIRSTPRGADVPILMLTGLDDTESIMLAYQRGATDFITKPINWTLLSQRVQYALRTSNIALAMKRSSMRLASAQRLANMGSWELFPNGDMVWSAQLAVLLGASDQVLQHPTAQAFLARVAPEDRDAVSQARQQLLANGTSYCLEFGIVRDDGAVCTVAEQATCILGIDGKTIGFEGITQDVSARVKAQKEIRQLANYDAITGLPNRAFFSELALVSIERARREQVTCALMHVDIDRFTAVNDAFGRVRGDAVLRTLAQRLKVWMRTSDLAAVGLLHGESSLLARVGSNAFTFLFMGVEGHEQAALVAKRLSKTFAEPIEMESQPLILSVSIGIALFPGDAQDLAVLTRCAEQAVYAAKNAGRAQHRFYDEQMNIQATKRLLMESSLRRAIQGNKLCLYFQPKIDVASGTIVGAEALVRWQHPERGMVPPIEFVPLAEECGLILQLTDWVLAQACADLRAWLDAGLPSISLSVNLAALSLTDPLLTEKLDAVVQRFGLTPANLVLEITESMLMHDVDASIALLHKLRDKGFGLSLDDFGTGYSSLSYLSRFPVHELKIDRSFVTNAAQGGRHAALAVAIIRLAQEFGMTVVAEGVETREQSDFLLRSGSPVQQGYLFSRPVPATAFMAMLNKNMRVQETGKGSI
jgi:diguanylate cyclase (GGDEF)-like protein